MSIILDSLSHWRMPPTKEEQFLRADVVVTHEFGDQREVSHTTAAIVYAGVELAKRFNKPMICQYPGNKIALKEGIRPISVIYGHLVNFGSYLDTEEVNRQVAETCKQYHWHTVILCSHPHHLWRAGRNMQKHGLRVLYPDMGYIPYDKGCVRLTLRTPWLFMPREFLARWLYHCRGQI